MTADGPGPPRAAGDDEGDADPLAFAPDARDLHEQAPTRPGDAPAGPRPPYPDASAVAVARDAGGRWMAAVVVLVALLVAGSLLTLHNARGGSPGVDVGDRLPPFAAPLAGASKQERDDVNLATAADQGDAGKVAACAIRDPAVVTSCAQLRRGPLVLMMFATGVAECVAAVDALDRLRDRHPGVGTLAVAIGGRHGPTAATARKRGWRLPVAYDRDGGLASRLRAPACPFVLFVRPDGTVARRLFGSTTLAELEAGMNALAAGPRAAPTTTTGPGPGR